ncbi:aminotransferase class I/II-fold pyridoxal phosphate-dependent enzyme [Streptomyces sp. NBC_01142]|uniref:aminotransferase class I/II-fold pyridoxal phosphate-dependent enzyme n=1 Tax=Streptomyces sp. NBC_01142 TaxID=2975865 RepID=UPI00224D6F6F|nr:aminotransferase class I/II-fold pyridoxal phosphate-dependent enzyme [Streptomyces sp. NBC_01142]MCX4826936.1 aminotransferase class I/II-fold pyridoxal phosphate-dependent enzyme [Streptomyces sp. NBC_01142]
MNRLEPGLLHNPSEVQGGDLTHLPNGMITLDLGLCTNRLGPPPGAVAALRDFLDHHAHRLMPPPYEAPRRPYRAERRYLQAFADQLGVDEQDMLAGRGVTEFLVILARLLRRARVAVITPEYTETMRRFFYADFIGPTIGARDTVELRAQRMREAMRTHDYVILSNPSNPLGHYIPRAELLEACKAHPNSVLVVDEEYIQFQPGALGMAGANVANLVVLQSTGKSYGITGTRAGMLWTRRASRMYQAVLDQLPTWPLSLLDITLATAALQDNAWLPKTLAQITADGRRLEELLTDRFGAAVAPADIHYRFVHLADPHPVLEHFHAHGITARLFTGTPRGTVPGLRMAAPSTDTEFEQLRTALETL